MIRNILAIVLGIFLILGGLNHFLKPEFYLKMMPPYIPAHELMVILSGIAEIGLGLGLMLQRFRRIAAWGTVLLFIAIFPANYYMYSNSELFPEVDPKFLLLRLPIQLVLLAWAYACTKPSKRRR